jgi:hypothetical protein
MNRYVAAWERLQKAMDRVMATGLTEDEAKSDLCQAISDRTIAIRLQPGKNTTTGMTTHGTVLNGDDVEIPARLSPNDIDWNNSRPLRPWAVRRERLRGYWRIEWVEVLSSDVTRIVCGSRSEPKQTVPSNAQTRRGKSSPALARARSALEQLHPDGVPGEAVVSNMDLYRAVGTKLKDMGLPDVSNDTILRAAGRRK